jgi:hypothetical protein
MNLVDILPGTGAIRVDVLLSIWLGTKKGWERHYGLERESYEERCGGRGYRVFAGRIPAASDSIGTYEDVGTVLITLSTSSVPSFWFSISVPRGPAISAIRSSPGCFPFERKIFPPVSST